MDAAGRGLPRTGLDDVYLAPVLINVGGTIYTSTLSTLTKYPESKLTKLFNGTLPIVVDPANRHYFLDVDGSVFGHILNFLRHGKLLLPENFNQLPLLKEQVDFFELEEMLALMQSENDGTEVESETENEENVGIEVGNENVIVKQRRRKRRNVRRKEKEVEERGSEMSVAGHEEIENDVVIMITRDNDTYLNIYSSADLSLSLEHPLSGYVSLNSYKVDIGHHVFYRYSDRSLFNPCIAHATKQLLNKGYKLITVVRPDSLGDYNKYVFVRSSKARAVDSIIEMSVAGHEEIENDVVTMITRDNDTYLDIYSSADLSLEDSLSGNRNVSLDSYEADIGHRVSPREINTLFRHFKLHTLGF